MSKKRAVVGIGTLIIFIAMILVAAVAAGVIIRTAGVLQERAYAVSGEARKRLVTGLEVLQVMGTSNLTAEHVRDIELYIRTRPGSSPVQLQTTGLTFATEDTALSAKLQHYLTEEYDDDIVAILSDVAYPIPFDMNADYLTDYLRVVNTSIGGVDDRLALEFNLTGLDPFEISLGINSSQAVSEKNISLSETPISSDGQVYGYLYVSGTVNATSNTTLNTSNFAEFRIKQFPDENVCHFSKLTPERYYCFEPRLGDADTILEAGELHVIKYRLTPTHALEPEETFQLNFLPKDGAVTYLESAPPSVITEALITLWPA